MHSNIQPALSLPSRVYKGHPAFLRASHSPGQHPSIQREYPEPAPAGPYIAFPDRDNIQALFRKAAQISRFLQTCAQSQALPPLNSPCWPHLL